MKHPKNNLITLFASFALSAGSYAVVADEYDAGSYIEQSIYEEVSEPVGKTVIEEEADFFITASDYAKAKAIRQAQAKEKAQNISAKLF